MGELEIDNYSINKLWNECSRGIKKLCEIKLHSDPEAAEDVYGEVYVAFLQALKSGREITYHKAWLYKVANNLIAKKYEEIKRYKEVFICFDDLKANLVELSVDIDYTDAIISDNVIELIADNIMDELKKEEQTILTCYHYDNMSIKDIAERIGKTESAVKQQHYRLCRKIKKRAKDKIENV